VLSHKYWYTRLILDGRLQAQLFREKIYFFFLNRTISRNRPTAIKYLYADIGNSVILYYGCDDRFFPFRLEWNSTRQYNIITMPRFFFFYIFPSGRIIWCQRCTHAQFNRVCKLLWVIIRQKIIIYRRPIILKESRTNWRYFFFPEGRPTECQISKCDEKKKKIPYMVTNWSLFYTMAAP